MWAQDGSTPTTALGALIVVCLGLAVTVGWLLRHLFGTTLPAREKAAQEEREMYKSESQGMRDLFERRQDKLLEHCKEESDKEREASERRVRESMAELKSYHVGETEILERIAASVREAVHLDRNVLQSLQTRTWTADMVTSAGDAIWSKTLDGIITSWNRAAEELLGWRSAEMIGRSVFALIPPEGHEQERQVLAQLAKGEEVDRHDTFRLHKDGRRLRLSVTVSPIKDPSGRVVGISSIAREL